MLPDLIGKQFGRLIVVERLDPKHQQRRWYCKCDCGNTHVSTTKLLRCGHVKSCGCLHADTARKNGMAAMKHGYKGTRLYRIWTGMKTRCFNPKHHEARRYSGRGISVCAEWLDFRPFRDWAVASGYRDDLTIDRVDGGRGYSPDNCRWVTMRTQQNNRANNHLLTLDGDTASISEWSRRTGIRKDTLRYRITKLGWSTRRALTAPVRWQSA